MGKTLSLDLRERVLAFIVEGHSCHEAARRFRISAASAVRIRQRRRQTGSIAPAKRGRPKGSSRLEVFAGFLKTTVDRRPDITMPELAEALIQEHDMRAAPAELSRFLKHRLGYTYKKILDCNGEAAQAGARRAIRVAAPSASRGCDLSRTGWSLSPLGRLRCNRLPGEGRNGGDDQAHAPAREISLRRASGSGCPLRPLAHPDLHCRAAR